MPDAIPTVVIVGRPNVGKSTLFNRITGQRRAIVGDEPGITRDRIHGPAEHDGRRFEVIDTGGIVVEDQEYIPSQILRQAEVALRERRPYHLPGRWTRRNHGRRPRPGADVAAPGQARLAGGKQDRYGGARQPGARVLRAGHRATSSRFRPSTASAWTRCSTTSPRAFQRSRGRTGRRGGEAGDAIKVAIIGRPNVGKSTLLNALTGQERAIVSPVAGTTRDAVDETVTRDGVEYVFVDTAGIRRKGKTKLMAEKLSVVMARRNIRMAHVVLLVLDATEGVVGLDATIAGYAHEGGRALILCVNKWDQVQGTAGQEARVRAEDPRRTSSSWTTRPSYFISAKTGAGVQRAVPADPRSLRIGLPAHLDRRAEPLCGAPAVRGAQDLLHHAALHPAARVRGVHRTAAGRCIFRTSAIW